jgi:hypothetical protein
MSRTWHALIQERKTVKEEKSEVEQQTFYQHRNQQQQQQLIANVNVGCGCGGCSKGTETIPQLPSTVYSTINGPS